MLDLDTPASIETDSYRRRLDRWHLDLSVLKDAVNHTLRDIEFPESSSAIAHVLADRFEQMVDTCPFPDGAA